MSTQAHDQRSRNKLPREEITDGRFTRRQAEFWAKKLSKLAAAAPGRTLESLLCGMGMDDPASIAQVIRAHERAEAKS